MKTIEWALPRFHSHYHRGWKRRLPSFPTVMPQQSLLLLLLLAVLSLTAARPGPSRPSATSTTQTRLTKSDAAAATTSPHNESLNLIGPAIDPPSSNCWVVRRTTQVGCRDKGNSNSHSNSGRSSTNNTSDLREPQEGTNQNESQQQQQQQQQVQREQRPCPDFHAGLKLCLDGHFLEGSDRSDCNDYAHVDFAKNSDGSSKKDESNHRGYRYSQCFHAWVCCSDENGEQEQSTGEEEAMGVASAEEAERDGDILSDLDENSSSTVSIAMIAGFALIGVAAVLAAAIVYYDRYHHAVRHYSNEKNEEEDRGNSVNGRDEKDIDVVGTSKPSDLKHDGIQ